MGWAGGGVAAWVLVRVSFKVAGARPDDARPFVPKPAVKPLFPPPADNGFPSEHAGLAIAIPAVVWQYRRSVAWAMLFVSVLIGVARVAAHVHHTQDIVAALIIGVLAAAGAIVLWRRGVKPRLTGNLARATR